MTDGCGPVGRPGLLTTELLSKSQGGSQPRVLKLRPASPFSQLVHKAYRGVARCAYELYESRGRQDGHDHWKVENAISRKRSTRTK